MGQSQKACIWSLPNFRGEILAPLMTLESSHWFLLGPGFHLENSDPEGWFGLTSLYYSCKCSNNTLWLWGKPYPLDSELGVLKYITPTIIPLFSIAFALIITCPTKTPLLCCFPLPTMPMSLSSKCYEICEIELSMFIWNSCIFFNPEGEAPFTNHIVSSFGKSPVGLSSEDTSSTG